MKIAYFAEPIDQVGRTVVGDRGFILPTLRNHGYTIYSPRSAWWVTVTSLERANSRVEAINRFALAHADLLVAYLPDSVPTIGVPREIEFAAQQGLSVVVIGESAHQRFALADVATVRSAQELDGWLASRQRGENRTFYEQYEGKPLSPLDVEEQRILPALAQELLWTIDEECRKRPVLIDVAPRRHYDDDAAFDLFVAETVRIKPNEAYRVPTGIRVQLPTGVFGWIVARSSTYDEYGLIVLPGIIDTGYRGPLYANIWNTNGSPVELREGSRICQLVLLPNVAVNTHLRLVDKLDPSDRGENGYGSTGRGEF